MSGILEWWPYHSRELKKLGVRLVETERPEVEDIALLHEVLDEYAVVLADTVGSVRTKLGVSPTSRVKNTGTILEKLRRHGGSWLKSINDLAGMRIVGEFDRTGQDELAERVVGLFSGERRAPRVIDRRAEPSNGYHAVHVIVYPQDIPVEIQIRTRWQHEWAELFEKLADRVGRNVRYGEPPTHWLDTDKREGLKPQMRELYDAGYRQRQAIIDQALALAPLIAAVEQGELEEPGSKELLEYRAVVVQALRDLRDDIAVLAR